MFSQNASTDSLGNNFTMIGLISGHRRNNNFITIKLDFLELGGLVTWLHPVYFRVSSWVVVRQIHKWLSIELVNFSAPMKMNMDASSNTIRLFAWGSKRRPTLYSIASSPHLDKFQYIWKLSLSLIINCSVLLSMYIFIAIPVRKAIAALITAIINLASSWHPPNLYLHFCQLSKAILDNWKLPLVCLLSLWKMIRQNSLPVNVRS